MLSPGGLRLRNINNRHEEDYQDFCPAGGLHRACDSIYSCRSLGRSHRIRNLHLTLHPYNYTLLDRVWGKESISNITTTQRLKKSAHKSGRLSFSSAVKR